MALRGLLLYPAARKFFAGTTLDAALRRARRNNALGIGTTVDYLGEDVASALEAEMAAQEYQRLVEAIGEARLDASASLKLTHIGLDIGCEIAENYALELSEHARDAGVFLWVDMEGSRHTDDIIRIYRAMRKTGCRTGIALQAQLKRTWADLRALAPGGAAVRLVKGAYREPKEVALQKADDVRAAFAAMMEYLAANTGFFAIGTHDTRLIDIAQERGYPGVEFQMLMGIRDPLKRELAASGRRVVEYVPYGTDWLGYGLRRISERKRNLVYFAQGLLGR